MAQTGPRTSTSASGSLIAEPANAFACLIARANSTALMYLTPEKRPLSFTAAWASGMARKHGLSLGPRALRADVHPARPSADARTAVATSAPQPRRGTRPRALLTSSSSPLFGNRALTSFHTLGSDGAFDVLGETGALVAAAEVSEPCP